MTTGASFLLSLVHEPGGNGMVLAVRYQEIRERLIGENA